MAYYETTHAPPWIDATQQWAPPTAAAPLPLHDVNKEPREFPQIVIEGIAGWYDRPPKVVNREGRTYGVGDVNYPSRFTGKPLVYECRIETDDRLEFIEVIADLQVGFGEDGDGVMTVTPWAPFGGPTPVVWTFSAAVDALTFDPKPVLGEDGVTYQWKFVLALHMANPTFYPDDGS